MFMVIVHVGQCAVATGYVGAVFPAYRQVAGIGRILTWANVCCIAHVTSLHLLADGLANVVWRIEFVVRQALERADDVLVRTRIARMVDQVGFTAGIINPS
jgi:hypothetical protein